MKNETLSDIETRRYSRQIMLSEIGLEGQGKLKNSKVLVIGAGGVGSPVLQYLTAIGLGTIGICDNSYVDETIFHKQILYGNSDLGKLKTIVAKEKLQLLNPKANFNIHNILFNESIAETILKDYDIVIDCTDNRKSKLLISEYCKKLSKPLVSGLINQFEGRLCVYNLNHSCNIQSLFPDQFSDDEKSGPNLSGVLGIIPGIIGLLMANEVVKIILGIGDVLSGKLMIFDALKTEFKIKDL
jgi:molybdopterin/thiamine biosynthesis adenylyltransferase